MFDLVDALPDAWSDPDRSALPADLDAMSPGPELARVVDGIDREQLSGYDRVTLMQARSRQVAHDQAPVVRRHSGGP